MKPKLRSASTFRTTMNQLIAKGEHADYFEEALRQFAYYQKSFSRIFLPNARKYYPRDFVFLFSVLYMGMGGGGDEVIASREVEITDNETFDDFAKHIILSMGWVNDHMHGFDLKGKQPLEDPMLTGSQLSMYAEGWEDDPHLYFKTSEIQIADIDYSKQPEFDFTFDYGDGHTFIVRYQHHEKMSRQDDGRDFPRLIASMGVSLEQYPPVSDY